MKPKTVVLCGAGMISAVHAAAARHLGMVVSAVASRSAQRRDQRAREWGARPATYDELPAGCDVVIVATPPAQHVDHALHSLARGAAVLIEKPLAATLADADRLADESHRFADKIFYAENLAYSPAFRAWIGMIAEADSIDHLSVRMEQSSPSWGDFLEPEWGGGVLFDLGAHPLALMVLSGRAARWGEVVSVSARMEGSSTDEVAEVAMTFASGAVSHVTASWRGGPTPHWSMQAASASMALTLELMPDIVLEHNGDPVLLAPVGANPAILEGLGYVDQLRAFRADLADGTTPWTDLEFGRWILEIVCACYVSARNEGEAIAVPSGCDRSLTPWQLWRG